MRYGMFFALASVVFLSASNVKGQTYPERPIRLVVPYAPGGNLDITARFIQPPLAEALGQPLVVENQGGAGGTIGISRLAKSAPDGYTLGIGASGPITFAPAVDPNVPYDPLTDLAPVGFITNVPAVLLAHPTVPAKNVQEFIALAKERPGLLTLGGAGTARALDLFQHQTRTKLILVRYQRGATPGLIDLMGGHIDAMIDLLSSSASYIKSGKVRALAVANPRRAVMFPNIPTLAESGVKGAEANTFSALLAPAGTPREIIVRLNGALNKVLDQPRTKERLAQIGAETLVSSPEQLTTFMRDDLAKWRKFAKDLDIRL